MAQCKSMEDGVQWTSLAQGQNYGSSGEKSNGLLMQLTNNYTRLGSAWFGTRPEVQT